MLSKRLSHSCLPLVLLCALLSGCASREPAAWSIVQAQACVLSDGTAVDRWRQDEFDHEDDYRLPDGTTLLRVQDPIGPENVQVEGTANFDDLSEGTQEAVLAYYERQGLLYDTEAELERAYREYLEAQQSGGDFNTPLIRQEILPTAANGEIICFMTSVTLPDGGRNVRETQLGAVFRRDTGELISGWDLFSVSQEEAVDALLSQISDPKLHSGMRQAIRPEYITLFPDILEVTFSSGTLPSEENAWIISIGYSDLEDVLWSWAIPDAAE